MMRPANRGRHGEQSGRIASAARAGRSAAASDAVRRARAEEESLVDEIAATEHAIEKLRGDWSGLREARDEAAEAVERARSEIIAQRIRPLLDEAQRCHQRLIKLVNALSGVSALSGPRGHGFIDRDDAVEQIVREVELLRGNIGLLERGTDFEWATKWRACRVALADPDAPLPALDVK
jgi:hypothetical protein